MDGRDVIVVEVKADLELNARPEKLVAAVEILEDAVEVGRLHDLLEQAAGGQVLGLHLLDRDDQFFQPLERIKVQHRKIFFKPTAH